MDQELAHYVESVALHWEGYGLPRIAGRILGLLMVCDPPHRSAKQLHEELGVSKGSISTMTRLLLTSSTIETVALPGDRATYYRLAPDSFEEKMTRRLAAFVAFGDLASEGAALLRARNSPRADDVEEVAELYSFLGGELQGIFDRWRNR